MSQLGEDIRTQQRVADHLAKDALDDARRVRGELHAVTWESSAGDFFRQRLDDFAHHLDTAQTSLTDLATHLGHHATVVEQHEEALGAAARWPVEQFGRATDTAGEWVGEGIDGAQRAWGGVTDFVGGIG